MKPITTSVIITAASSLFCGMAQAQPGTESSVIITMTEHYESAGTTAKDQSGKPIRGGEAVYENEWDKYDKNENLIQENYEYVSKIDKYKISNKELLEAFQEDGVIPEIAGWSLKIVEVAANIESEDGPRFFLRKTGVPPIDVSSYFQLEGYADAEAAKQNATVNYKYDSEGVETSRALTVTGTAASRSSLELTIGEIDNTMIRLYAIADTTSKVSKLGTEFFEFFQGGKLVNISGGLTYSLDEGGASVIDGTWSFATPVVIPNLSSVYPNSTLD